ncbi:hypothetical protein B0O80DRAFT_432530 [Mortierella sp. GBAus27b]|nr:hypothetical protein B0O80DRAFT_432530 [Mortierella sp. GBAus27b]
MPAHACRNGHEQVGWRIRQLRPRILSSVLEHQLAGRSTPLLWRSYHLRTLQGQRGYCQGREGIQQVLVGSDPIRICTIQVANPGTLDTQTHLIISSNPTFVGRFHSGERANSRVGHACDCPNK